MTSLYESIETNVFFESCCLVQLDVAKDTLKYGRSASKFERFLDASITDSVYN